jgi:hypothetical protein
VEFIEKRREKYEIWGCHSDEYKDYGLLEGNTM